jgi:hypothetical protein
MARVDKAAFLHREGFHQTDRVDLVDHRRRVVSHKDKVFREAHEGKGSQVAA